VALIFIILLRSRFHSTPPHRYASIRSNPGQAHGDRMLLDLTWSNCREFMGGHARTNRSTPDQRQSDFCTRHMLQERRGVVAF
jgi:hypothetical protein